MQGYREMLNALSGIFPEAREISIVYLFSQAEADRVGCYGQCNRFSDGSVSIGVCISLLKDLDKLRFVLLHEMAHLRYWEHSEEFNTLLKQLISVYNAKTGKNIREYPEP